MTDPEPRPTDNYYETRTAGFSQGDIFGFPVAMAEFFTPPFDQREAHAALRLLSGPLEGRSLGMLISPTAAMRGRGTIDYFSELRTLVPIVTTKDLLDTGRGFSEGDVRTAQSTDGIFRRMYIPDSPGLGIEESLALLDEPVTVAHKLLLLDDPDQPERKDLRLTQLTLAAAKQLQRKLVWFATGGGVYPPDAFHPPMD